MTGAVLTPVQVVRLRRAALGLALGVALSLLATGWAHAGLGQWTSNGPFPGFCAQALAIDTQAPASVYVTTCQSGSANNGPFKSTTGGASWAPANAGLEGVVVNSLAPDPGGSPTVYAATSGGVFKSVDGSTTWASASAGLTDPNVTTLAVAPSNPNTLYAGTASGVFKSTDAGLSWTFANQNLPRGVSALAVEPQAPTTVYAAAGLVFKSTDGGGNWSPMNIPCSTVPVIAPTTPSAHFGDREHPDRSMVNAQIGAS